jgi:hypothetical protein
MTPWHVCLAWYLISETRRRLYVHKITFCKMNWERSASRVDRLLCCVRLHPAPCCHCHENSLLCTPWFCPYSCILLLATHCFHKSPVTELFLLRLATNWMAPPHQLSLVLCASVVHCALLVLTDGREVMLVEWGLGKQTNSYHSILLFAWM